MKTNTKAAIGILLSMTIAIPLICSAAPGATPPDANISPTFSGINITDTTKSTLTVNTASDTTTILGLFNLKYSGGLPTYYLSLDASGLNLGYDENGSLFSKLNFTSQSALLSSKNGTAESAVNLNGGTLTTKAVNSTGKTIITVLDGEKFAINDGTNNTLQIATDGTITNKNGIVKIVDGSNEVNVGNGYAIDTKGAIKSDGVITGEYVNVNKNLDVSGVIQNQLYGSVQIIDGLAVNGDGLDGIHMTSNGGYLDIKNQATIGARGVGMSGFPALMQLSTSNASTKIQSGSFDASSGVMTIFPVFNVNYLGEISNDSTFNNGKVTIGDTDGLLVKGPIGKFYAVESTAVPILAGRTATAAATCKTGDIAIACEMETSLSRIAASDLGRNGTTTTCTGSYFNWTTFSGTVKTIASCFSSDG